MQPIILCGLGNVGWRVLETLHAARLPVVAVDKECAPDDPRLEGLPLVRGDFLHPKVLEQAGIACSSGVLILTSDDLLNISAALMMRERFRDIPIILRVFNPSLTAWMKKAIPELCPLNVTDLAAPLLALTALTGEALVSFDLDNNPHQVAELTVAEGSEFLGRTIADLAQCRRLAVLAHKPAAGGERSMLEIAQDARLEKGDRLVVCGQRKELSGFLPAEGEGSEPLWAGWFRRHLRLAGQTLSEIEWPVKICTAVLLIVVLGSTLVYHLFMGRPLADGLFRTISVIATGADMHGEELTLPWQKVFVSIMRIMGLALTATFTAIITNYLVRTRLGNVLETRRIPDGGHVIVCGLGNIGFRLTEELLQRGQSVVVIERSPDKRLLATARRLGAAVIVGDATDRELLVRAHAASAQAVIATTESELLNLEIALLARAINPRQRVIPLADPHLAQTLRKAVNILAISTSTLAAPAFIATLFGNRILSVLQVAGQLLAVVELTLRPDDPWLKNQAAQALRIDYQLLPVTLKKDGQAPSPHPWDQPLEAGDRLTAITPLANLGRLLRQ